MLAELVTKLQEVAAERASLTFHSTPGLPRSVFVKDGDSPFDERPADPPLRNPTLAGMDDLVAMALNSEVSDKPAIYLSANAARLVLDDDDRREVATVPMAHAKRFLTAGKLEAVPLSGQPKAIVKFLRYDLNGAVPAHVIQALSRLNFQRTSAGATSVEHGRESLGRSVEAQVQQADQVPETFVVAVPIWATAGFRGFGASITCGIYLDLEAQAVELRVMPDESARAIEQGLAVAAAELAARFQGKREIPIYLGNP